MLRTRSGYEKVVQSVYRYAMNVTYQIYGVTQRAQQALYAGIEADPEMEDMGANKRSWEWDYNHCSNGQNFDVCVGCLYLREIRVA